MTAVIERALLARAHDLADTSDLAGQLIEIIGWARAARVDQAALAGLVTAVRLLDGDPTALFRAVRGRHPAGGKFGRDTELLDITSEAEDDVAVRARAAAQLRRQAGEALQRARADSDAAAAEMARAQHMPITEPCRGCHGARARAIAAAQRNLDDARERGDCASAALAVLAPLKLPGALRAIRRVPDDLHEIYAAAYDLVARDRRAMPKDGDFITGETAPAAMAAKMLAARAAPTSPGGRQPATTSAPARTTPATQEAPPS